MAYHKPVLLAESVEALQVDPNGVYVDATFGGGGHSNEILKHLKKGKLLAFDQDENTIANKPENSKVTLINQNFRYLKNFLKLHNAIPVQGILADLGVSSFHFDESGKGFSFRNNEPLDMRMGNTELTAGEVVNSYEEKDLAKMFRQYGELKNAKVIAGKISKARTNEKISSVQELKEAISSCTPKVSPNKFLAKVFQAIRIEVNQELEALKEFLIQTSEVIAPGGRLVVISYHSLEDRLVKNFMKTGGFDGHVERDVIYGNISSPFKQINKGVIVPTTEEIQNNSRARSAKMRVAEKV